MNPRVLALGAALTVGLGCDRGPTAPVPAGPEPVMDEHNLEQFAPGRAGEVRTLTVGDFTIEYEILDGLAILEGDMVLGAAEELAGWSDAREIEIQLEANVIYRRICRLYVVITDCTEYRWPNGVVPYEIRTSSWEDTTAARMEVQIRNAMRHWEERTGIVFIRRSTQPDHVVFRNGDGCSSRIGRQGGSQSIRLNPGGSGRLGCGLGTTIHEIGHALGLGHEQSRDDRDEFVEILWDNIESGRSHNFRTSSKTFDSGRYDLGSIMHYGARAFGIRDQPNSQTGQNDAPRQTVRSRLPGQTFGQRSGLSDGDIAAIYRMYATPPELTIIDPADGQIFSYREDIRFAARATDWGGRTPAVIWLRGDERLGTGLEVTTRLPLGGHRVTARAEDFGLKVTERSISVIVQNFPPSAQIQSPAPTTQIFEGVPFTLRGNAIDPDGGPVTCRWTSSRPEDPLPVTGCEASVTFSTTGGRILTLTAADELGASARHSVAIGVQEQPVILVDIASPEDGAVIAYDETLTLSGSASGGTEPYAYRWTVTWPFDPETGEEGPNTAEIGPGQTLSWRPVDTIPESELACQVLVFKVTLEATDAEGRTDSRFVALHSIHIC